MPTSATDRSAILELAARYLHSLDCQNVDAWVECFTEDGVFDAIEDVRVVGHDALRKFISSLASKAPSRHTPATLWVQGEGKSAMMRSYFTVMPLKDPTNLIQVGRFEDRLVNVDGEWKFAERRVITDWKKGD
jgi:hypothetical protein